MKKVIPVEVFFEDWFRSLQATPERRRVLQEVTTRLFRVYKAYIYAMITGNIPASMAPDETSRRLVQSEYKQRCLYYAGQGADPNYDDTEDFDQLRRQTLKGIKLSREERETFMDMDGNDLISQAYLAAGNWLLNQGS